MRSQTFLTLCIIFCALLGSSCNRLGLSARTNNERLLEITREYRTSHGSSPDQIPFSITRDDENDYFKLIQKYVNQRNFPKLESEALNDRATRTRFVGGVWKLNEFYLAAGKLRRGDPSTDASWNALLTTLKVWVSAYPKSATARIALAEAYVNYAWEGRGEASADETSEQQWQALRERAQTARSTLIEAASLEEKCPYWYEAMQHVAHLQGWKTSEARELMEQAVLFEPHYYHFYREYAYFLEPRWYGTPGEAEAFAEEVSTRLGEKEGAFIYFEIASLLTCQCNPEPGHMENLSWPKIMQGYQALDELYGVSSLKLNRYAHMALLAGDRDVARQAFLQIGDRWNPDAWDTKADFDQAKQQTLNQSND